MREAGVEGQTSGHGSLFAIHLHRRPLRDYWAGFPTAEERGRAERITASLLAHGVFVAPGLFGCRSTPMEVPEVEAFVDAFTTALREGGLSSDGAVRCAPAPPVDPVRRSTSGHCPLPPTLA